MKIQDNRNKNSKIRFKNLDVGQIFIMPNDSDMYMKVAPRFFEDKGSFDEINVINLITCVVTNFNDCDAVIPINTTLIIED